MALVKCSLRVLNSSLRQWRRVSSVASHCSKLLTGPAAAAAAEGGRRSWPVDATCRRLKHGRKTQGRHRQEQDEDEDEDDEEEDEELDTAGSKLLTGSVPSLRTDAVIKAGLGVARNKVETLFYESRIRVNGRKISKKSHKVEVGDEIDVVSDSWAGSEGLLKVSRLRVLRCTPADSGGFALRMRRYKSLTIDNYQEDPWTQLPQPQHTP